MIDSIAREWKHLSVRVTIVFATDGHLTQGLVINQERKLFIIWIHSASVFKSTHDKPYCHCLDSMILFFMKFWHSGQLIDCDTSRGNMAVKTTTKIELLVEQFIKWHLPIHSKGRSRNPKDHRICVSIYETDYRTILKSPKTNMPAQRTCLLLKGLRYMRPHPWAIFVTRTTQTFQP